MGPGTRGELLGDAARAFAAVMMAIGRDARKLRRRATIEQTGEMVEQVVRFAFKDVKPVDVLQAGLVVAAWAGERPSASTVKPPSSSTRSGDCTATVKDYTRMTGRKVGSAFRRTA